MNSHQHTSGQAQEVVLGGDLGLIRLKPLSLRNLFIIIFLFFLALALSELAFFLYEFDLTGYAIIACIVSILFFAFALKTCLSFLKQNRMLYIRMLYMGKKEYTNLNTEDAYKYDLTALPTPVKRGEIKVSNEDEEDEEKDIDNNGEDDVLDINSVDNETTLTYNEGGQQIQDGHLNDNNRELPITHDESRGNITVEPDSEPDSESEEDDNAIILSLTTPYT